MADEAVIGRGLVGHDEFVTTADARRLRTMVGGSGDDLVVLEAGLGLSGLYWGPVHEAIAERARVVAYERAGFGASSPDDRPRDLARLVADLETVVDAHPHRRLVLVGHSWGGPVVRVLAARRRERGDRPAGVVLVDQSDEHSSLYFGSAARRQFAAQAALMVPLARMRLLSALSRGLVAGLAEPMRRAVLAASTSVSAARATAAEQRHVIDGLDALRARPLDLGDIPVSVISGQRTGALDARVRASIVDAHRETARRLAGGRYVPAELSGHMVPISEPGLVASEALSHL
ncbi:alpha/beta hydrolase [Agromyces intestinalis]|uniref:Alpha/beta hydrolase n=1 Tax=Agromyces intestinalis TaxID=2592652 RepID=A0A5C1YG98_9MICO|nr:alpha/beta hydrolase [Agromyces intestinalis]QEO14545.1 alpha/beta hydrolase [Agromyces intestinalis]